MKKLMIVAAAVSLAAVSQAVTLDWGLGGKVWVGEKAGEKAVLATDYTGTMKAGSELCLIYVGQNKSSFALGADGKLADGQTVVNTIAYAVATSGTKKGKWNPTMSMADLANYSDGASFAIVFNNGGKYDYVYAVDASGNIGSAYQTAIAYADLSGKTALPEQYGTGGSGVAGAIMNGGAEPVPEPTSGLLLLVGMAGLALRRRRA